MLATRRAAASSPPWVDLPADLLGDIAGRLHTMADHVRFHAVCWSWRHAHVEEEHKPRLPWLLAPSSTAGQLAEDQRCRCVFSKSTYHAPGICVRDRRVACTNGAAWWLITGQRKGIRLVNPLTGDAEQVPFRDERVVSDEWLGRRHRIISGDGAVLLYDFDDDLNQPDYDEYPRRRRFRASFMRPGSKRWLSVSSHLSYTDRCCAAAYHRDGFVVCVDLVYCHVLKPYWTPIPGGYYYHHTWQRTREVRVALPDKPTGKLRRSSYLVECDDGRLLLATVLQDTTSCRAGGLSVSLHELCVENNAGKDDDMAVEWVRRDDSSDAADMSWLGEHVLFLGFPASFAAKAAPFDGEVSGGMAYFIIECGGQTRWRLPGWPAKPCCSVYMYSFHDGGAATLVETLPLGWHDARCLWFLPRPQIQTRFQQREEGSEQPGRNSGGDSGAKRQQLRIYAGHFSTKVDNSRLREMFSVYGKVERTRVAYDKRGRSRGFGFVTMATQEGFDKAMAALNPEMIAKKEPDESVIFVFIGFCLVLLVVLFLILQSVSFFF